MLKTVFIFFLIIHVKNIRELRKEKKMRETKLYICEVCGTQYADKKKCLACEKSHKKPVNIVNCKYIPQKDNNKGYPIRIDIKMEDGNIVSYKR